MCRPWWSARSRPSSALLLRSRHQEQRRRRTRSRRPPRTTHPRSSSALDGKATFGKGVEMKNHACISQVVLSLATVAALCAPIFLAAQAPLSAANPTQKATSAAKDAAKTGPHATAPLPRTPDVRPDLHGYWPNLSFTPMERPAKYQGREFLTEKEMQDVYKAGLQVTFEGTPAEGIEGFGELYNPGSVDYDVNTYALSPWQNGLRPNRRSSLVVDPPDGRIPPLTAEAKATPRLRAGLNYVEDDHHDRGIVHAHVPWDLGTNTTCISMNSGPPILPSEYNSNLLIVHSP